MKKYLLTAIGNFESTNVCKDLAVAITPLVDSPQLKFQHTNGVLIFHFASKISKEDILEYLSGLFYGVTDTYILSEMSDNLSVIMPEVVKGHLFDLEKSDENISMKIDMERIKNNLDWDFTDEDYDYNDEDERAIIELLMGGRNKKVVRPSLNEILDKISNGGVESLSPLEKRTLETYSKN